MPRDPAIFPTARACHGLGATAALLLGVLAGPAMVQAQDAPALRYLDCNGRPAPVAMARAETPAARGDIPALRPVSPGIPHAGTQSYASVPELRPATPSLPLRTIRADGRPGLTPADAFFAAPQSVPLSAPPPPPPASPPQPVRAPVAEARPAAPSAPPPRQAPVPAPVERPAPQPVPQTVPAPAPTPAPTRPPEWADDPMAPRADAPIWSVGQSRQAPAPAAAPAPAPAASQPVAPVTQPQSNYQTERAPQAAPQGARYYSVHRQNGRQPDRTIMPEQVYLDALPIEMEETPVSPSMARPPEPPQLVRNPDGTVRRTTGESASSAGARQ